VGSAVRFYMREQKARIGLPEVVRLETEFHLRTTLSDHIEEIRSNHRQLLAQLKSGKRIVADGSTYDYLAMELIGDELGPIRLSLHGSSDGCRG
jgi:hypothetical protein